MKYTLVGKKIVLGKKKLVYKKEGSRKLYCKCKGKMMNIVKYKKMKMKKMKMKKGGDPSNMSGGKKRKSTKTRKTRKTKKSRK
jgi:hypothetical protein